MKLKILKAGLWAVLDRRGQRVGLCQRNAEGEWQGYLERGDAHVGRFETLIACALATHEAFFREWPQG